LRRDNLVWLKGQAAVRTSGNVSEMLNTLIAEARTSGRADAAAIRSVAGTIDLPDDDSLGEADAYVRAMFERSLARPMLAREKPPVKRPGRRG
jgi:nucleoid-associated protein YgaU